jgi:hypothetical protein
MKLKCAACGDWTEEHYNGEALGNDGCAEFVLAGSSGRWTPPKVIDQPRFGAASQYVVARLDEISERIDALEKSVRASVEIMCVGRQSNG